MDTRRTLAPTDGETLCSYLKRSREASGWSQDELVRRTGLSLSTIRKIEDGRTPNPGVFTLIAVWKALNLPPDSLIRLTPHKQPLKRRRVEESENGLVDE